MIRSIRSGMTIAILCCVIYFVGIYFGILKEGFMSGGLRGTTLPNYEITEKETATGIRPNIFWTYRYICEQFPFVVHTFLQEWSNPEPDPSSLLHYLHNKIHIPLRWKEISRSPLQIRLKPELPAGSDMVCQPAFQTVVEFRRERGNKNKNENKWKATVRDLPVFKNYSGRDPLHYAASVYDTDHILFPEEESAMLLDELANDRKEYRLSRCFSEDIAVTKENQSNQTGCLVSGGKWDGRCQTDSDCPYFQKNKHYPNNLGGCDLLTGFCQFPRGMKNISYRTAEGVPLCHNCGRDRPSGCCPRQKFPDYAYEGDISERQKYQELLASQGLRWIDEPRSILQHF